MKVQKYMPNSNDKTHLRLALAMAEKEKVARKSNTLDHRGDRSLDTDPLSRSPIKNKKDKVTRRSSRWARLERHLFND